MKVYKVYEMDRKDKVCRMTTTNKEQAEEHCSWLRYHFRKAWVEIREE